MSETEIYALDLDDEVICHLADHSSVMTMRAEQVNAALILDPLAKAAFEWQMEHIRVHGKPATGSVLEDQFDGDNVTTEVEEKDDEGRKRKVKVKLPALEVRPPDTAVGDLIVRLRERYMRNEGKSAIERIARISVSDPLETAKELLREGRRMADLISKRGEIYGTGDFDRAMMAYDKEKSRGAGPSLGFDELDEYFNGQRGLTFLMAGPKTYKSWFAIRSVIQNILDSKMTYLYSLELPAVESYWRMACMAPNTPYWKYLKTCLMPHDERALKSACEMLDDEGTVRIEKPAIGERSAQRLVERALNAGAQALFIDQLQYIENEKGNSLGEMNATGEYFGVCNTLRDYSDEIPIFVVHQFNRSIMNAKEMPEAQQGKGSAAIEEVATLGLGLWANKEMRRSNTVQLGTLISRNYGLDGWNLDVNLSTGCELIMRGKIEEDEDDE